MAPDKEPIDEIILDPIVDNKEDPESLDPGMVKSGPVINDASGTPNVYGLIRQRPCDLIALPFLNIPDFNNYTFEILKPSWSDGYFGSNGIFNTSTTYESAVIDVSEYKYVICGSAAIATTAICGLRNDPDNGTFPILSTAKGLSVTEPVLNYTCFEILSPNIYLCVSRRKGFNSPVIGVK